MLFCGLSAGRKRTKMQAENALRNNQFHFKPIIFLFRRIFVSKAPPGRLNHETLTIDENWHKILGLDQTIHLSRQFRFRCFRQRDYKIWIPFNFIDRTKSSPFGSIKLENATLCAVFRQIERVLSHHKLHSWSWIRSSFI